MRNGSKQPHDLKMSEAESMMGMVTYIGPAPAHVYGSVFNPQGGVGVDTTKTCDYFSTHKLLQRKDTNMNTEDFYPDMNIPQAQIEQQIVVNAEDEADMSPFLYKTDQRTPASFLQSPFLAHTSNDDRNLDANIKAQTSESFEAGKRKIKSESVVYENYNKIDPIRDNLSYIGVEPQTV